jgi:hypothetical protein
MAKDLKTELNFRLIWKHTDQPDSTLSSLSPKIVDSNTMELLDSLTDGTAQPDVARVLWHDIRVLAGSANETFDLAGGLVDVFGETLTFTIIRSFCVINRNLSTDADGILEVGAGSNPWDSWLGDGTDLVKVGPGGALFIWNPSTAGFAVTAGTADILKVANTGAGDVEYQIAFIGE